MNQKTGILIGCGVLAVIALFGAAIAAFAVYWVYFSTPPVVESSYSEPREKENLKNRREESLRSLGTKLEEFVKLSPPTKLAPHPYLKGKAVIIDTGSQYPFYFGYQLAENEIALVYPKDKPYSSSKEIWNKTFGVRSVADGADDVQTVIQLKFTDTVCRWYGEEYDYEKGAQLCGVRADITVIDRTIPAIIAKKTFTNNKLPKTVKVSRPKDGFGINSIDNGYQMYPFEEIEGYLKTLDQK